MAAGSARPFLKWAGGKRQLLPALRRHYPADFGRYFEPFLGSGAVFFDLVGAGLLSGRRVVLSDNNPDLIGCYLAVRRDVESVIDALRTLEREYARGATRHYYEVRDRRFNPVRAERANGGGLDAERYTPELAAMLIYLNRTGYNGLFRLNASGGFNVPAGRYVNPTICDANNLRAVARALKQADAEIRCETFDRTAGSARAGDFLYFDPPYAPLSRTALFTSYTAGGFGEADQRRLRDVVVELAGRGCHVVLSNSSAPLIRKLYVDDLGARSAGLLAHAVRARRAINSRAASRGDIDELVITTVPAAD